MNAPGTTRADGTAAGKVDGRVERGDRTRRTVLARTMEIASMEGVEALSLGRVAHELHLSKSGVFALFGSLEDLQLATLRAARAVFIEAVVHPALTAAPGLPRVWALCSSWIGYSRGRVFPGGCLFQRVVNELSCRPGPLRDAALDAQQEWQGFLRLCLEEAVSRGQLHAEEDLTQLAFETTAVLDRANTESLLAGDDAAYDRAATAIRARLRAAALDDVDLG